MKRIKVCIYSHENDSYNELYKVIKGDTKKKYFARHTFGNGEWYFVSDPLGYCELDYSCPEDYIFIVCDGNGKELFEDSNGKISNPFPTLKNHAKQVWARCEQSKTAKKDGLSDWLLTFMTADKITKDMNCPEVNWTHCWYDNIGQKIVKEFIHLGEPYCIYEITMKHRYGECEWIEYMCGHKNIDLKYPYYVTYFGATWDEQSYGLCYSPREAHRLVVDALKEVYGNVKRLSRISEHEWGGISEQKYNFETAAMSYLGSSYSQNTFCPSYDRQNVGNIIENIKNERIFYTSREDILKDYDAREINWDYSLSWL